MTRTRAQDSVQCRMCKVHMNFEVPCRNLSILNFCHLLGEIECTILGNFDSNSCLVRTRLNQTQCSERHPSLRSSVVSQTVCHQLSDPSAIPEQSAKSIAQIQANLVAAEYMHDLCDSASAASSRLQPSSHRTKE